MDIMLYDRFGKALSYAKGDSRNGGLLVTPSGADFDEAVERGNVFVTANQTTVVTQAGLSATTPALTIANRAGSGKVVRLWYASTVSLVAPVAAAAVWACLGGSAVAAAVTETTLATIRNMKTGDAGQPNGIACLSVATLPAAPVAIGQLGAQLTGAITTAPMGSFYERWYNGALRIAPGFNFTIQTSTASTIFCEYIFEVVDA